MTADEYAGAVAALSSGISALNGMSAKTYIDIYIRTHSKGGYSNITGLSKKEELDTALGVLDAGANNDKITLSTQSKGGQLGKGWTLVGDAPGGGFTSYSELISPTGYVFSNTASKALLASGMVRNVTSRSDSGGIYSDGVYSHYTPPPDPDQHPGPTGAAVDPCGQDTRGSLRAESTARHRPSPAAGPADDAGGGIT